MDIESYKSIFSETAEDNGLELKDSLLEKLARRAIDIERECDFSIDDIFDEFQDTVPSHYLKNDEFNDFLSEITNFVFDEMGDLCYDSEDEYAEEE